MHFSKHKYVHLQGESFSFLKEQYQSILSRMKQKVQICPHQPQRAERNPYPRQTGPTSRIICRGLL